MKRFEFNLFGLVAAYLVAFAIVGCGGSATPVASDSNPETPTGRFVSTNTATTAGPLLSRCLQAYHRAETYQDQARVVLQYTQGSGPEARIVRDEANLSTAIDRRGGLGLRAYLVSAGMRGDRFELSIGDENAQPFEDQLLVRARPEKLKLDWVYSDPMVERHLGGGLAGFPPQLDLFLGEKPLEFLLGDSAMSVIDGQETIEGNLCDRVKIKLGVAEYILWIDCNNSLIRRMALPQQALPPALTGGGVSTPQLSIEFRDAKIDQAIDWTRWEVSHSESSKQVRQLVLAPPLLSTDLLGKVPAPFTLPSPDQLIRSNGRDVRFDSEAPNRKVTILAWLADHPACRETADLLNRYKQRISGTKLAEQVDIMAVWAESTPPPSLDWKQLAASWGLVDQLVLDPQAIGRDIFHVKEAPTIVVLAEDGTVQYFQERANPYLAETLMNLTQDMIAGRQPAQIAIREYQYDLDRYNDQLRAAAGSDATFANDLPIRAYPPRLFRNEVLWQQTVDPTLIAIATPPVNSSVGVWTLSNRGLIKSYNKSGVVETQIDLSLLLGKPITVDDVKIAPADSWMVVSRRQNAEAWLVNYDTKQVKPIDLNAGGNLIDSAWLDQGIGDTGPWLAMVDDLGNIALVEPNSGKRLNGRSPKKPVALFPQLDRQGHVERLMIVQVDGSLEPLLRPGERSKLHDGRVTVHTDGEESGVEKNYTATKLVGFKDDVPVASPGLPARLTFQPSQGPWCWGMDRTEPLILATGEQHPGEPVAILMNGQADMLWHYPIAARKKGDRSPQFSTAVEHASGMRYWSILSPESTIHLVRVDGGVHDHFSLGRRLKGAMLTMWDQHLIAVTLNDDSLQAIRVEPLLGTGANNAEPVPLK